MMPKPRVPLVLFATFAIFLVGASGSRKALDIDPENGVAYRSNLTVHTVVTSGTFVGDGSKLTGVAAESTTNWLPALTVTGAAALGDISGNGAAITNLATNNIAGLASFVSNHAGGASTPGTNWYSTLTVTGSASLGAISGDGSGITNLTAGLTNWLPSVTVTGVASLSQITLGAVGQWSYLTGSIYEYGRLYATNANNLLGGDGANITGLTTSQIGGLSLLVTNIASTVSNITSHLIDVDTYVAQTSTGGATWYEPESGSTYDGSEISVYPVYTNPLGIVFGSVMSGSQWGGSTYHGWAWPAQPGAIAYHVHIHTYFGVDETDYYTQTTGTNVQAGDGGGTNITAFPSALSSTNEFRSIYAPTFDGAAGTNALLAAVATLTNGYVVGMVTNDLVPWGATNQFLHPPDTNGYVLGSVTNGLLGPPDTNGFVTASITNGLDADVLYPPTNVTIYVNPHLPGPMPYMTSLVQALTAVDSIPGVRSISNRVTISVSGQNRFVADGTHTYSGSNYNYLSIRAEPDAITWCDISPMGDVQSYIVLAASNITISGGKWVSYTASGQNERFITVRGYKPSIVNCELVADGANGNNNASIVLSGSVDAWIKNSSFVQGPTAGSGARPFDPYGTTNTVVQGCLIGMYRAANCEINLGGSIGTKFLNCVMICSNTSPTTGFMRNNPNPTLYENCSFVNLGTTNTIGIPGDADSTIWMINCTHNIAGWLGDTGATVTGIVTVVPGYSGIKIVPQD